MARGVFYHLLLVHHRLGFRSQERRRRLTRSRVLILRTSSHETHGNTHIVCYSSVYFYIRMTASRARIVRHERAHAHPNVPTSRVARFFSSETPPAWLTLTPPRASPHGRSPCPPSHRRVTHTSSFDLPRRAHARSRETRRARRRRRTVARRAPPPWMCTARNL